MEGLNKNRQKFPAIFAPLPGNPLLTLRAMLCYSIVTINYGSVKLEGSGFCTAIWPITIT